jgi:excisionase family DNA binding protein
MPKKAHALPCRNSIRRKNLTCGTIIAGQSETKNQLETMPPKTRKTESRLTQEETERILRDPPPRMSLAEAAAYLNVSPRALRGYVRKRIVSRVKLGGRVIFRREALDADLAKLEQPAL